MAEIEPYPEPTDPVEIVVYATDTGDIRQFNRTTLEDMHRQHPNFDGCDYLDVTGQGVQLDVSCTHVVDLANKVLAPRVQPGPSQVGHKKTDLMVAHRDSLKSFSSAAIGQALTYDADMTALTVACVIGGELSTNKGHVTHTADQAKAVLTDFAAARVAAQQKLDGLNAQVDAATTIDEINSLNW